MKLHIYSLKFNKLLLPSILETYQNVQLSNFDWL